jgi:hypothetical protein
MGGAEGMGTALQAVCVARHRAIVLTVGREGLVDGDDMVAALAAIEGRSDSMTPPCSSASRWRRRASPPERTRPPVATRPAPVSMTR